MLSAEQQLWSTLLGDVATDTVRTDGVEMFAVRAGGPERPVVFVGGLGDATPTWSQVIPAIAKGHRVVAYDRPGMGASPPARTERTLERLARELAALLEQGGDGPAVLAAHSLGGLIALRTQREAPERVAGLALIDPTDPAVLARGGLVALQKFAVWLPRALSAVGLWRPIARSVSRKLGSVLDDPHARDALQHAILENLVSPSARRATSDELNGVLESIRRASAPTDADPISVPVTVLSATRGAPKKLRAHLTEAQQSLAGRSPSGRHEVVDGGHYLHRERPDVVVAAVRGVWERAAGL